MYIKHTLVCYSFKKLYTHKWTDERSSILWWPCTVGQEGYCNKFALSALYPRKETEADWMIEKKKTDLHGELETDAKIEAKSRTFFVSLFSLIMFILCMDMWSQWHSVLIQCPFHAPRSEWDVLWPVQYLTDLSDTNCWQCIYRDVWSQRAPDHLWIKTIWSAYTTGHVQYPIWPHLSLKSLWRHYLRYKSNQDLWEHG